jgi:hypothetical protein
MTTPAVFKNKDGLYSWLVEDRDTVLEALAGICEDMAGASDEHIAESCRAYLRGEYKRFISRSGRAYGLSPEETADMVREATKRN